mmetsp:Transcript_12783/g.23187  ORF Transcript_12783/g.23187 Transcript_12783/m.23187 type:complete len:85 (-) Transcript_12783:407-661(-)
MHIGPKHFGQLLDFIEYYIGSCISKAISNFTSTISFIFQLAFVEASQPFLEKSLYRVGCSPHSQHGGIALRLIGCGSYIQEKKQ